MSEDQLAHKIPPSATPSKAEHETFRAGAMKTAQGSPGTGKDAAQPAAGRLGAIGRMETAMRGGGVETLELFLFDVADMAQAIVRTKAEIAAIKPPPDRLGQIDNATGELDSIVRTTEAATSSILTAAEQVQEIAWTLRERGIDDHFCDHLDAQATEIYTACSFQDLTGQRTRKVIQVLRYLEHRVNTMIEIWGKDVVPAPPAKSAEASLLNGPSADGLSQAQVDRMMGSAELGDKAQEDSREELQVAQPVAEAELAQDERRDATIEDIERVMMALDPFARDHSEDETVADIATITGTNEGVAAGSSGAAIPATAFFEERRPELSAVAAVSNEMVSASTEPEPADLEQSFKEALTEPAPDTAVGGGESEVREFAMEFSMSARTTAALMQVQAAALNPAEDAWATLERLTLALLPQPLVPAASIMQEQPGPEPNESAARAAASTTPETPFAAETGAVLPPLELELPQAPAEGPESAVPASADFKPPPPAAEIAAMPAPDAVSVPPPATAAAALADSENSSSAALEIDADEFLFAPDHKTEEPEPADFLLEPLPLPPPSPQAPAPVAMRLNGADTSEQSATPCPASAVASFARPLSKTRPANDPLAPLRALSDEEKIALFS